MQYSSLIQPIINLSVEAGAILMKHFKTGVHIDIKGDNSPVTIADHEADRYITSILKKLTPNIPIISEEGDLDNIPHALTYWLVDPLDGTRSFIKGENEFTVNVGLVVNNQAYLGVIFVPALDLLYYTGEDGKAYKLEVESCKLEENDNLQTSNFKLQTKPQQIKVSSITQSKDGYRVIASKNHRNQLTEDYIKTLKVKEIIGASSSYKFCLIAEGKADIYPRFGNTMQWDTCAGQAILEAAGGKVISMSDNSKAKLLYKFNHLDKESLRNPHFIAYCN